MNGLCDPDPTNLSLFKSPRVSLAELVLVDGDGLLLVTAATWKIKGAGVRGSKDL